VTLAALDDKYLKAVNVDPSFIKGVIAISGIYSLHSPLTLPEHSHCSFKTKFFHTAYTKSTFGSGMYYQTHYLLVQTSPCGV
jgi:hypothetical protein